MFLNLRKMKMIILCSMDIKLFMLMKFLKTMKTAILHSENIVKRTVQKASFWQRHREVPMNDRQLKVINLLWDGFEGKLTSSKWAKITKSSQATALRDITDLVEKGILTAAADGGRSTHYLLQMDVTFN